MTAAPSLLCGACVAVLLLGEHRQWPRVTAVAKLGASSAFLWLALQRGALDGTGGQLLFLGLLLCWCGDLLLLSRGQSRIFRFGIGAFLLAHLAYGAAFVYAGVEAVALAAGLAGCALAGLGVLRWLKPHLPPEFRVAVPAYVAAIFAMVAAAIGAVSAGATVTLLFGAVLFAISDLAVARQRFVQSVFANRAFGLPLYYAAQLLIAAASGTFASLTHS